MASSAWIIALALLALSALFTYGLNLGDAEGCGPQLIQYTRDFLLQCNSKPLDLNLLQSHHQRICSHYTHRKRKRGKKGGIRQRLKSMKTRLPLPTRLLINAQPLKRKTDELTANVRYLHEYRGACVLAITETWLDSNIPSWSRTALLPTELTAIKGSLASRAAEE